MKVGIIQQANTEDRSYNKSRLSQKIGELASQGAELVVLQELHNGLYFCQEENVNIFDQAETIPGESTDYFGAIAKEWGLVLVLSLFEKVMPGVYHNTAVVIEKDGTIAGKYRKMHIPDDPAYYEKYYFTQGDLGFEPIDTSVGRLGVLVCWDQWYPEAARIMALKGAELLIYPTAIGVESSDSKEEQERQLQAWQLVQRGHSVANNLPVITVNRVGYEADPSGRTGGITFWGNSFVTGSQGELLCHLDNQEALAIVDISKERTEFVRRWWPFFRDRRIDAFQTILKRTDVEK